MSVLLRATHSLAWMGCSIMKYLEKTTLADDGQDIKRSDKSVAHSLRSFERGVHRQRTQAVRAGQRRNLAPRPPRRRNWDGAPAAEWDDLDIDPREQVMPIDERDRRLAIEKAAFQGTNLPVPQTPTPELVPWTVISVTRGLCVVEREGERLRCRVRSRLTARESGHTNSIAAGDRVVVVADGTGLGIIEEVLPRDTSLARPETYEDNRSRRTQVVVANAEQVLIVSSWREPFFWPEFVDRCIIAAWRSNLRPIVCVTKVDLAVDVAGLEHAIAPYLALGLHVVKTSSLTRQGIDELRDLLHGCTTALTGMSGVGKSSLISAVQPGLDLPTSKVSISSKRLGEGRHTTTMVEMHKLDAGGYVVDTPGIREFGLVGLHRREIAGYFPEISALAPKCRFANCTHLNEPGCAVVAERATGLVPESRYHSYRRILSTLPD